MSGLFCAITEGVHRVGKLKILVISLFAIFYAMSAAAVSLNITGGTSVELSTTKQTSPALCVKMTDNTVWYGSLTTDPVAARTLRLNIGGMKYSLIAPTPPVPGPGEEGEPFKVTLTGMTASSQFSFRISASGNFAIDWGDGGAVQVVTKTDTAATNYSHTYVSAGNYIITIGGKATGYGTSSVISFIADSSHFNNITNISGDLGSVFPILNDTAAGKPRFMSLFGSSGPALPNLNGPLPANFFSGLHGAPGDSMFASTFMNTYFTGPIPENLFAGIQGAPTQNLFSSTFLSSRFSGQIPAKLFSGIRGAPATGMFSGTFMGDGGLTGIGDGLFDGISGAAQSSMFYQTFQNSANLTGPSAKSDGQFLYQKWPAATTAQVGGCYTNATGLSDYSSIPAAWK